MMRIEGCGCECMLELCIVRMCLRIYVSVCVEGAREGWTGCLPLSLLLCPFFVLCHTLHTFSSFFSFLSSLYVPSLFILAAPCSPWPCLPSFIFHALIHSSFILHFHSTWSPTLQGSQLSHCELFSFETLLFSSASTQDPTFTSAPPAAINTMQLRTHAHSSHRISQFERYLDPEDGQTISLKEFKDLCFGGN